MSSNSEQSFWESDLSLMCVRPCTLLLCKSSVLSGVGRVGENGDISYCYWQMGHKNSSPIPYFTNDENKKEMRKIELPCKI